MIPEGHIVRKCGSFLHNYYLQNQEHVDAFVGKNDHRTLSLAKTFESLFYLTILQVIVNLKAEAQV